MFLEVDQLRTNLFGIKTHIALLGYGAEVMPFFRHDHVHPVRVNDQPRKGFSIGQYGRQVAYPNSHPLETQPFVFQRDQYTQLDDLLERIEEAFPFPCRANQTGPHPILELVEACSRQLLDHSSRIYALHVGFS